MSTQTFAAPVVGAPTLPRVNLLPPEIAEHRRFRRIQAGLAGSLVGAVAVVAALYVGAHGGVSSAQSELDTARAEQTGLQQQVAALGDVSATYGSVAAARAALATAMGDEVQWSRYLNDLSLRIPDNVWLTNMSVAPAGSTPAATTATTAAASGAPAAVATITFTGVAFSHDDVAVWLESLARQKGYANAYFTSSTEAKIGPRTVVNFASTVTVTADALSKRYTTTTGSTR